jgi:hypothetical protein
MEQADIFPRRICWLAIVTGIASALALFPVLFLLYPALLIAGGIVQPRFPGTGKWFIWVGAALLGPVLAMYDVMMVRDAFSSAPYTSIPLLMTFTFPPATILLIWCDAELLADGVKKMRARRLMPPPEPRPVGLGLWILAAALNLLVGWEVYGIVTWYHHSGGQPILEGGLYALGTPLGSVAIVVALDVSLINRHSKIRRSRIAGV